MEEFQVPGALPGVRRGFSDSPYADAQARLSLMAHSHSYSSFPGRNCIPNAFQMHCNCIAFYIKLSKGRDSDGTAPSEKLWGFRSTGTGGTWEFQTFKVNVADVSVFASSLFSFERPFSS